MTKTRSQQHSADALICVRDLKPMENDARKWLDSLPNLILVNGLIAALIKLKQEAEKSDDVARILLKELNDRGYKATELSEQSDSATYLRAQRQALDYVAWLKRWGQSLLDKPKEEKDDGLRQPNT